MPHPFSDPQTFSARLTAIVDSSNDAIVSKDLNGIIETWNKGAQRIFGYSAEEAIGRPILLVIPEHLHHEEDYILSRLRQGERIDHYETVRRRKDGSFVDISLTVSPITDATGRVIGASKIARDITAQKRAQRSASEAQRRLAVTLASIGDAVIATDTHGLVTFANAVAEKVLGYTQPDLLGRHLREVFHIVNEDTRRPVANPVDRVLEEGCVVGLANHTVLMRPDGREVPIADSGAPIRDDDGQLLGVVLVFRDVTEEHRAAQIAGLLAAIVNSSDDAIVSKDFSGTVTSWNTGAEHIFGYTAAEMIGQSIRLLIPPDRQDEEDDILKRLRRGQRIDHYETVRRRKDGQLRDISLTISPIRDSAGRLIGASKIARDVTELKRAQRALYEAQERWRVTLESIADGVIATDAEGRVTFANPAALRLLGRMSAAVLGNRLSQVFSLVNEQTREAVSNPIDLVIRERKVMGLAHNTVLQRPDGTEIRITDSGAPIMDSQGRLVGVVLVFRESVMLER